MKRKEPLEYLLDHQDKVIEAVEKNDGKLPPAWEELKAALPGIEREMSYHTFKVHQKSVFIFKERMTAELGKLGKDKMPVNKGIPDKVRQVRQRIKPPDHFQGWAVRYRDPYYRLCKRIDGKLHWLHIGRKWSEVTARDKIRSFSGPQRPQDAPQSTKSPKR